ncbi:pentatricopeptide repeat-containing protein 1, mitochondrial [Coregonus clupeaformis]|uniref:pentatricopeptide repeat-containing protein 1, mitochondrial n=1 Tax=Coregonus clupeaformis TaxID=59861 RepID=UPI001BDFFAF6|nr:pentatricopeptide repeat-containing protein 1, mitochondrial [Coregonus clupeaformis]
MLQCVSRSCLRNGRSIVDYVVRYGSTQTARGLSSLASCNTVRAPRSWTVHPVTDIRRRAFTGSVSLQSSRRSRDAPEPPAAPSRTGRAGNDLGGEDFGSLSADFSSRRAFRKTTPELQEMLYREERQAAGQEEEREPVAFRSRTGRRNTQYWYFLQCKRLIKENKLSEALSMFQSEMLEGERLQPEEYNYTVLIGGCGRAGQLKHAFKLYNDMKKRGLVPSDATYTALFNACAESPRKPSGLQQAIHLEQELRRKNHPLSDITYHALLKTHALTNHLRACLHTLRDMLQAGHAVTQETFHFLLMGCVRDRDTGFRQALQVYRQMLRMGIRPDIQNYNLLLRAARDCGVGDPAVASALLLTSDCGQGGQAVKVMGQGSAPLDVDALESQLFTQHPDNGLSHHSNRFGHHSNDPSHHSNDPSDHSNDPSHHSIDPSHHSDLNSSVVVPVTTQLVMVRKGGEQEAPIGSLPCLSAASTRPPNLLDLSVGRAGEGCVVSLGAVSGAFDRLALMGGAQGFLDKMATAGLCPDIRTLTLLADIMEPGSQSLHSLLAVAKQHGVKLDAAFYNSVIRRAARAGDLQEAKAVMCVMQERRVRADVRTYGSLALGCNRQTDALQLLGDMQAAGVRPSVQVFSALIGCASRRLDYVYLRAMLRAMREHNVPPNDIIIIQLEHASQYPPNYNQYKFRNTYLSQIDGFRGYYQQWLTTMPAQETGGPERDHPTETRQDGHQQAAVAARRYRKQHS